MRLHLVAPAHTQTTRAYSNCAFTELARKMADMMTNLGHEVIVYGGEENEAKCSEHVECLSRDEQRILCKVSGPDTVLNAGWSPDDPHWALFSHRVNEQLKKRISPSDIVLLANGWPLRAVIEAFPENILCEYAVGYTGWHEKTHRVIPSQAWLHALYGRWYGCHATRGRFLDRVIPHYFDPDDFPLGTGERKYLLFLARLNEDKGIQIAIDTAKTLGAPLVVAGQGSHKLPDWVDYRGIVGIEDRGKLMAGAAALMSPSLYLEPFGKAAVEAQFCGTPVISTDWGAYPETVEHGFTGWRCNSPREFAHAARTAIAGVRNHEEIRERAISRFSTAVIGPRYASYFQELIDAHKG